MDQLNVKHDEIFEAIRAEYNRQAKGAMLAPQVVMLKTMMEAKIKPASTPQAKAEIKNILTQISAIALKQMETL